MTTEPGAVDRQGVREYVPVCCCWPANTFGGYLWGSLLVLLGSVWLLSNLNLLPQPLLEVLWPLVLSGSGWPTWAGRSSAAGSDCRETP